MIFKNTTILSTTLLVLSGCASSPSLVTEEASSTFGQEMARQDLSLLHGQLLDQYEEWKGTPYRLGGLDKQGIDCSGFVHVTYQSKAGVSLPRTTQQQAGLGQLIAKGDLRTGDLVFFKINGVTRHVGIYLQDDQFLHASKSEGVMISDMDNPYWQRNYWKSKRLGY